MTVAVKDLYEDSCNEKLIPCYPPESDFTGLQCRQIYTLGTKVDGGQHLYDHVQGTEKFSGC